MRGWLASLPRRGHALRQRPQAARVLQRIAGRHQPPDAVELEPLQRQQAGAEVRFVGRIERAAEQADAHPRRMRGQNQAGRQPSRPDLPRAADAIFEAGELLDADRAAGVQLAGGDADLGAEAEFAAVGELGRGVVQHDRGIDLVEEFFRRTPGPR